jgi:Down syndrome cell adhesion protein 1
MLKTLIAAVFLLLVAFAVPPAITPFTFGELSKGERVKVTCSVKRGDMPLSISWMKDHQPVSHELAIDIRDIEDYSSILAITSVSSRHSGNYTCVARNPAKETTYTAELVVTGNVLFSCKKKHIHTILIVINKIIN